MNITDYINGFKGTARTKERARLCAELNISDSAFGHWYNGIRQINHAHALLLERFTEGKIKRSHVRPDIWPPRKKRTSKKAKGLQES